MKIAYYVLVTAACTTTALVTTIYTQVNWEHLTLFEAEVSCALIVLLLCAGTVMYEKLAKF